MRSLRLSVAVLPVALAACALVDGVCGAYALDGDELCALLDDVRAQEQDTCGRDDTRDERDAQCASLRLCDELVVGHVGGCDDEWADFIACLVAAREEPDCAAIAQGGTLCNDRESAFIICNDGKLCLDEQLDGGVGGGCDNDGTCEFAGPIGGPAVGEADRCADCLDCVHDGNCGSDEPGCFDCVGGPLICDDDGVCEPTDNLACNECLDCLNDGNCVGDEPGCPDCAGGEGEGEGEGEPPTCGGNGSSLCEPNDDLTCNECNDCQNIDGCSGDEPGCPDCTERCGAFPACATAPCAPLTPTSAAIDTEDGLIDDWIATAAVVDDGADVGLDSAGAARADAEIRAVHVARDADAVFLRIELAGAPVAVGGPGATDFRFVIGEQAAPPGGQVFFNGTDWEILSPIAGLAGTSRVGVVGTSIEIELPIADFGSVLPKVQVRTTECCPGGGAPRQLDAARCVSVQ